MDVLPLSRHDRRRMPSPIRRAASGAFARTGRPS